MKTPLQLILAVIVGLLPAAAMAQESPADLTELSLEQLLDIEIVSTASKFAQKVTRAPASVTIVTAEDIRRHGFRTLADVLNSVRGIYTSNDRNYSYAGVRGFARPGDYNTRVLLLVDGHRLNEPTYDMAPVGTDFPIDLTLIERIEVIRGPGSSLYGTNAFFAVVNVITRTGQSAGGVVVSTSAGSLGTGTASMSYGRTYPSGKELLIAASGFRTSGASRLFYPEYRTADGDGIAVDADGDRSASAFLSSSIGRISVRGAWVKRGKDIPTGSFGSIFNDGREHTLDERSYADVQYTGPIGGGWTAVGQAALDHYRYRGAYPYDNETGTGSEMSYDTANSLSATGELMVNRHFSQSHFVTIGAELRDALRNRQRSSTPAVDDNHPSTTVGVYAQDEMTLRSWLIVNAGARIDRFTVFGSRMTPRLAVVLLPRRQTAVKLLYGRAYRAPNAYESYYYADTMPDMPRLKPETVTTTELVLEEYIGAHLRTSISGFAYDAERLIEQRSLTDASDLYFVNAGRSSAHGIEGEVEGKWNNGLEARVSHAYASATDERTGLPLSNSPRQLSQLSLASALHGLRSTLAFDGRYIGRRLTLDRTPIAGAFVSNLTTTTALSRKLELTLSLYNALNQRYADPGAEEHLQRAIEQDGRTFRARLTARF